MGGIGSGSWYRLNKKDTVEDCWSIDVRRWQREGCLEPGQYFSWTWSRDGQEVASISARTLKGAVELSYTWERGDNKNPIRYSVPLAWTPCNFGGSRPWFLCPGVVHGRYCGRRVAKLYLRWGYFLCRHCHDLTYSSRQDSTQMAALHKCQRIRQRLGGSANMTKPFPPKPTGMHWKTYWRLRAEHDEADWRYTVALSAWIDRLNNQLSKHKERLRDR